MKVVVLFCCIFMEMLLMANGITLVQKLNSQEDICRLFSNGVILRRPGSCTETIKCNNGQSAKHTVKCTGAKILKLDKMTCATDSKLLGEAYCKVSCSKSSPYFITDPKSCDGWTECSEAQVVQVGRCPDGQLFKQDEQRCVRDHGECDKTYSVCDVAKTNQKFLDESSCQRFFYCNSKKAIAVEKCPVGTYYDARSGQCIKKSQVECNQHPLPIQACGTKKLAIQDRFVSDQDTCRGYLYCRDLGKSADGNFIPDEKPNYGLCPVGEFFDEESQTCNDMNNLKCKEDRCDRRQSGKVLSERPGCQHYLECKDGYTAKEVKCPDNNYFNPLTETCDDTPITYRICK